MFESIPKEWIVYGVAAASGVMLLELFFMVFSKGGKKRADINRRLRLKKGQITQKEVLVQLRKERGMDDRKSIISPKKLQRLKTQSGMKMSLGRFVPICVFFSTIFGLAISFVIDATYPAMIAPIAGATLVPSIILGMRRKRRHKQFGEQFPEALDLIVRGLKAGHPVPVALSMVAREMPDPIGSEFGIITDELTFGSDIITALHALNDRVGHQDLPLFISAVKIQAISGGKLREVLEGLAGTIRERGKLRRKIRAVSTEGRMSAYILTALPAVFAAILILFMPGYYGEVINESMTWYLVSFGVFLLGLGNVVMAKMANLKI